ncbi:predicted protein [Histoplasma capsulatum G186AR]|uniref:Uncharacterized protein n=1 Tax=Ajellomyces capsulatus (strain G186AR / H82 / ATCC MYA-2454 / RMSCC 2432) TaxID=447093 RepID=C0NKK0_AJECG|nr:uncharacterized protein HCBG_03680 [Histoplasma capsulatum G186AR]EEH08391.1 predicted protein [Histoplasma capsulatum G186AR]
MPPPGPRREPVLKFTPTIRFAQKAYLVVVGLVRDKAATEEEVAAEQPGRNIQRGGGRLPFKCKRAADLLSQKGEAMKEVITLTSGAAGQILTSPRAMRLRQGCDECGYGEIQRAGSEGWDIISSTGLGGNAAGVTDLHIPVSRDPCLLSRRKVVLQQMGEERGGVWGGCALCSREGQCKSGLSRGFTASFRGCWGATALPPRTGPTRATKPSLPRKTDLRSAPNLGAAGVTRDPTHRVVSLGVSLPLPHQWAKWERRGKGEEGAGKGRERGGTCARHGPGPVMVEVV